MIRFIEKIIKWFEEIFLLQESTLPNKSISLSRRIQYVLFKNFLIYKRHQGIIVRALIAWLIGLFVLHLDEVGSYDLRLSLRGDQTKNSEIVLIDFTNSNLDELGTQNLNPLNLTEDSFLTTDSQYSKNLTRLRLLFEKLIEANPKIIGVSFFFDERMSHSLSIRDWELFTNENIIWMGALTQGGVAQLPPFADKAKKNYGFTDLSREEDGMTRAVSPLSPGLPSFSMKLAKKSNLFAKFKNTSIKSLINFRGSSHSFTSIQLNDLLNNKIKKSQIENKTILIGINTEIHSKIATPVGVLTRSEIIAHITDNIIHDRWIVRLPKIVYAFELFIVMLISVFFMTTFPQMVAFVFLTLFSLIICSFSIWFFDTLYIWTPALSPLIQIMSTWSLFVGYLASRIEKKNWQLEQEKKSIAQLEQLKNNFVSLISHDLKTPIAKIQAIVERLLLKEHNTDLTQDLKSLRSSSHELHRYIQSILKILRVESRDFHLNKEVTDINDLINTVIPLILPLAQEKQIQIIDTLEPLFSIEVDSTLIQEVIINILENAIKYTPSGGQVLITTEEIDQYILIKVIDTGEGISPEDQENVFGKFVRGKNQDLKTKGSGLGLYLVKYFVELHGGRVLLTSQVGNGTTVELYLPTEQDLTL